MRAVKRVCVDLGVRADVQVRINMVVRAGRHVRIGKTVRAVEVVCAVDKMRADVSESSESRGSYPHSVQSSVRAERTLRSRQLDTIIE